MYKYLSSTTAFLLHRPELFLDAFQLALILTMYMIVSLQGTLLTSICFNEDVAFWFKFILNYRVNAPLAAILRGFLMQNY